MIRILIIVIFTIATIWTFQQIDSGQVDLKPPSNGSSSEDSFDEEVTIYITGAIKKPNYYTVLIYSYLSTIIDEAGGVLEHADYRCFDYDLVLENDGTIYIPSIYSSENKVSINNASVKELSTLSNVGETIASRIVIYRETVDSFKKLEDITNVSGIGDATFEKLKDHITL